MVERASARDTTSRRTPSSPRRRFRRPCFRFATASRSGRPSPRQGSRSARSRSTLLERSSDGIATSLWSAAWSASRSGRRAGCACARIRTCGTGSHAPSCSSSGRAPRTCCETTRAGDGSTRSRRRRRSGIRSRSVRRDRHR